MIQTSTKEVLGTTNKSTDLLKKILYSKLCIAPVF